MDFFAILQPLEWLVANIMVIWHQVLEFLGMDPAAGITWALSIVGLVVTIRIALIPLFRGDLTLKRREGALLLTTYVAYVGWLLA